MVTRTAPQIWLAGCLAKVDRLSALEPNWDSYGAEPVGRGSIEMAKQALRQLALVEAIGEPFVTASPNGCVVVEWEDGGRELEIDFLPDGRMPYIFNYGDEERTGETSDVQEIAAMLTGR